MNELSIIDAHLHIGPPGLFFTPESSPGQLLSFMDSMNIGCAVCADHLTLAEGAHAGISYLQKVFEESNGRIFYVGVFDPRYANECLTALKHVANKPGFVGLKIHPSFHRTSAEDKAYMPAWNFAADHDVAILTHSWSPSDYNPVQMLSTPLRFEEFVKRFPDVRLVLGHVGGLGSGRHEAVQIARDYPNVYVDIAGDIFDYQLIQNLVKSVPAEKILFGSDYPWLNPRAHLSRVLLSNISTAVKKNILMVNASHVYKIGLSDVNN